MCVWAVPFRNELFKLWGYALRYRKKRAQPKLLVIGRAQPFRTADGTGRNRGSLILYKELPASVRAAIARSSHGPYRPARSHFRPASPAECRGPD